MRAHIALIVGNFKIYGLESSRNTLQRWLVLLYWPCHGGFCERYRQRARGRFLTRSKCDTTIVVRGQPICVCFRGLEVGAPVVCVLSGVLRGVGCVATTTSTQSPRFLLVLLPKRKVPVGRTGQTTSNTPNTAPPPTLPRHPRSQPPRTLHQKRAQGHRRASSPPVVHSQHPQQPRHAHQHRHHHRHRHRHHRGPPPLPQSLAWLPMACASGRHRIASARRPTALAPAASSPTEPRRHGRGPRAAAWGAASGLCATSRCGGRRRCSRRLSDGA